MEGIVLNAGYTVLTEIETLQTSHMLEGVRLYARETGACYLQILQLNAKVLEVLGAHR